MNLAPLLTPEPMHIPDGFLSVLVSVILWVVTVIVVAYSLKRVNADLDERTVPMMETVRFTMISPRAKHAPERIMMPTASEISRVVV